MRRLAVSLVAAVLLCGAVMVRSAADFEPLHETILSDADALGLIGGAVVIVQSDEHWVWTFGTSDSARQTPVSTDTVFSTGSVAKPLIAHWLATQANAMDMPLSRLWPDLDLGHAGPVTLAQAVGQTSGFPRDDAAWLGRTLSPAGAAALLRPYVPVAAPGERFTYNSVIFAMAAQGVARSLGVELPWITPDRPTAIPFELTLAGNFEPVVPFDHGVLSAAVDARISPQEMTALLPALVAEANTGDAVALEADALERSCCPLARSVRYGRGWFVEQFEGYTLYSHPGTAIGSTAVVMVAPELGLGVAVFVNQDHAEAFVQATRYSIVLHALGQGPARTGILIRRAQAERAAWAALAESLGPADEPVVYGMLDWPTANVDGTGGCRVVLQGPLLGQHIGTDCTKP